MLTTSLMSNALGLPVLSNQSKPDAMNIDGKLKGVSILLVENEPDSAELFNVIFELAEAEVVTVSSAGEALETLEGYEPHILISNIALPDLDGYLLLKEMFAYEKARGRDIIPVAVTASERDVNLAKVISAGFHAHVPKPIDPAMLVTVLATLLVSRHRYAKL